MLQFTSAPKFTFTLDDKAFALPALTLDLARRLTGADLAADPDGSKTVEFFESISDKRTAAVMGKLTPTQFTTLLKEWMGSGEGSRSAE